MPTDARRYRSEKRQAAAARTRARILDSARRLFSERGIEATTLNAIAEDAGVAVASVYKVMRSKEGILRALMEAVLFGPTYRAVLARLADEVDPVVLIERTAEVARAIYEAEARELGDVRAMAGFSPALGAVEAEFEALRLELQAARVDALFDAGRARLDLTRDQARRVLWLYTAREVWRKLTVEAGWSGEEYESWLRRTLVEALVAR
jgi:AcrR family transcriptional regulator